VKGSVARKWLMLLSESTKVYPIQLSDTMPLQNSATAYS